MDNQEDQYEQAINDPAFRKLLDEYDSSWSLEYSGNILAWYDWYKKGLLAAGDN